MGPEPIRFGQYQLYERIAVGGMAELFFATAPGDPMLERGCVIKRVLPHLTRDTQFITMFLDEAKIVARLNHPGITRIFDLGKQGDHYFIAMEHLAGKDCVDLIEHGHGVPYDVACAIAMRAAEALHFAHEARDGDGRPLNLIHRDVSPSNVFVTYDGHVKLLDFGIARASGASSETMDGCVKGKAGYMAPEQMQGLGVDRRADVWSLGVSLYELLISRSLFTGEESVVALKEQLARRVPPSAHVNGIPAALDAVVLKAICVDWEQRFATAEDFARALVPFAPQVPEGTVAGHMFAAFGAAAPNPFSTLDEADPTRDATAPANDASERPTELAHDAWKPDAEAPTVQTKPQPARPLARWRKPAWVALAAVLAAAAFAIALRLV